jgi:hypothetical protein
VGGVRVEQPYPKISADLPDFVEEVDERGSARGVHWLPGACLLLPEVHAKIRGILADQVHLLDPVGNELPDLADDRVHGAAAVAPAHLGDHAKRTRMVATLRNFDVGGVPGGEPEPRGGVVGDVTRFRGHQVQNRAVVRKHLPENFPGLGDLIESEEGIDLGELVGEFLGKPLGHAAADDEFLAGACPQAAELVRLEDRVHRLLLGRVDKPAGIDDQDIRLRRVGGDFKPLRARAAEHDLGINQVLRTPEADHPNFLWCGGHGVGESSAGGGVGSESWILRGVSRDVSGSGAGSVNEGASGVGSEVGLSSAVAADGSPRGFERATRSIF